MGVAVLIRPGVRSGLGAVSGFRGFRFRQCILQIKNSLYLLLRLGKRIGSAKISGEVGGKLMGVMVNPVQVVTVFVISGVQAFVVIKFILQSLFLCGIGSLNRCHFLFFRWIGSGYHTRQSADHQIGAGGNPACKRHDNQA